MQEVCSHIAVLGAGAWGTALATRLVLNGHKVKLWGRDEDVVEQINQTATTPYLKGVSLPEDLKATTNLTDTLNNARYILIVVPSHAFNEVCAKVNSLIDLENTPVAWATKGVDPESGLFLNQLLKDRYHVKQMALISGPSFAAEVAANKATAINIVSRSPEFQQLLVDDFSDPSFRIYKSDDYIGSQICAIFKNVLAIAAGACDGKDMGLNARAALLTRGLEETRRLVVAMGGEEQTVYGLCGLGDLLLTATGDLSRNRKMGIALTKYPTVAEAARSVGKTIEGKANVDWLLEHANKLGIDLPISSIVAKILNEEMTIDKAIVALLTRQSNHSQKR